MRCGVCGGITMRAHARHQAPTFSLTTRTNLFVACTCLVGRWRGFAIGSACSGGVCSRDGCFLHAAHCFACLLAAQLHQPCWPTTGHHHQAIARSVHNAVCFTCCFTATAATHPQSSAGTHQSSVLGTARRAAAHRLMGAHTRTLPASCARPCHTGWWPQHVHINITHVTSTHLYKAAVSAARPATSPGWLPCCSQRAGVDSGAGMCRVAVVHLQRHTTDLFYCPQHRDALCLSHAVQRHAAHHTQVAVGRGRGAKQWQHRGFGGLEKPRRLTQQSIGLGRVVVNTALMSGKASKVPARIRVAEHHPDRGWRRWSRAMWRRR